MGQFIKERLLEINFMNSRVMRIGCGSRIERTYAVCTNDGVIVGEISETNVYLGVKLSRSRTFLQHVQQKLRLIPRKVALQSTPVAGVEHRVDVSCLLGNDP